MKQLFHNSNTKNKSCTYFYDKTVSVASKKATVFYYLNI